MVQQYLNESKEVSVWHCFISITSFYKDWMFRPSLLPHEHIN